MSHDIAISQNWDGTCNLSLDGEVILERKSMSECKEKGNYLATVFLIDALKASSNLSQETA